MWRATGFAIAFAFVSSVASAQQPCTTDARRVVDELYRHMLERGADNGSQGHVDQLQNGQVTVRELVRQIAKSPEHNQRFVKMENGEDTPYLRSVNTLYRHILGRQPDAAGARGHAQTVQRQGINSVIDTIVDSQEYSQRYGDWGVPGSGGVRYCGSNNVSSSSSSISDSQSADTRFRQMDRNNDGTITQDEWRGGRQAFRVRDTNNDGILSGNELNGFNAYDRNDRAVATSGRNDGNLVYVDGTQRWTDTGIDVQAGQTVVFDAQGSMQLSTDGNDTASPSGSNTGRRAAQAPVRQGPAGGLIARVGNTSPTFVGARGSMRASTSGRLFIGVNDDYLQDNSGEYRVNINVRGR
jgi:hypothetical protein